MEIHFCWRCNCHVPLLDEPEWAIIAPILENTVTMIRDYRAENHCDLQTAQAAINREILNIYKNMTGYDETSVLAIHHHRRSLYGRACSACGHLYRTPTAKFCANCGAEE